MKKILKLILILGFIVCGTLLLELNKYNKIKELNLENFKYEYNDSGSHKEKIFRKNYKYNKITKLTNAFIKDLINEDYTKENTYLDYIDYYSSNLKEDITESDKEKTRAMIREEKSKVEYIKSNLYYVTFDSYFNKYYIEMTAISFMKNNLDLTEKNKYYENIYFLEIEKENKEWVVTSWSCYVPPNFEDSQESFIEILKN